MDKSKGSVLMMNMAMEAIMLMTNLAMIMNHKVLLIRTTILRKII
jgi:hypothetical protein